MVAGVALPQWEFLNNPAKAPAMKKLTIAQAARELNAQAAARLNHGGQDETLKTRIAQFTSAVEEAITELQRQVAQLQAAQKQPSVPPHR